MIETVIAVRTDVDTEPEREGVECFGEVLPYTSVIPVIVTGNGFEVLKVE